MSDDLNGVFVQLAIFLILVIIGFFVGSIQEKRHFTRIRERELRKRNLPAVNLKKAVDPNLVIRSYLVTGSVVIAQDYFKRAMAGLYGFFGGEIKSYQSLLERARREAVVQMKEKAHDADIIVNVKIETSTIGNNSSRQNTMGCVEAIAYGTALILKK
jgi:uncharacterized protein YbjQ (UPF0145 family)